MCLSRSWHVGVSAHGLRTRAHRPHSSGLPLALYSSRMPHESVTYSRDVLYEQVWAAPVRDVAKQYGVSGVALAKTCRKLAVPLPGRGYWAIRRAGKAPPTPKLPPLPPGVRTTMTAARQPPERRGQVSPATSDVQVTVPRALRNPHPLVAQARETLKGPRSRDGMLNCGYRGHLDICISPFSLGRALRVLDALLKAFEKRGMSVAVRRPTTDAWGRRDDRGHLTQVRCGEEWVSFRLREQLRMQRPPASEGQSVSILDRPRATYGPSGVLSLSMTDWDCWRFQLGIMGSLSSLDAGLLRLVLKT